MEWQFIAAMVIAIPIILFPVALIWFANIGGLVHALKERKTRAAEEARATIKI